MTARLPGAIAARLRRRAGEAEGVGFDAEDVFAEGGDEGERSEGDDVALMTGVGGLRLQGLCALPPDVRRRAGADGESARFRV